MYLLYLNEIAFKIKFFKGRHFFRQDLSIAIQAANESSLKTVKMSAESVTMSKMMKRVRGF